MLDYWIHYIPAVSRPPQPCLGILMRSMSFRRCSSAHRNLSPHICILFLLWLCRWREALPPPHRCPGSPQLQERKNKKNDILGTLKNSIHFDYYGVVYGSPCGRPEKVCLFTLPWLALRRTGFSSEKNCCYSFLSSSKKNWNDSTYQTGWLPVIRSGAKRAERTY